MPAASSASTPSAMELEDEAMRGRLIVALRALADHKPDAALVDIDAVIATYEARYRGPEGWRDGRAIYCSRTVAETIANMLEAAAHQRTASDIRGPWADAYYLESYALTDEKRFFDARVAIDRALELSPHNAVYLAESAQLYVVAHDWPRSLAGFRAAASAAEGLSPPQSKSAELRRAWRGIGYADVELRNLDEAEAMYRKCLELDPDDKLAARELDYVLKLRQRTAPN